MNTKSILLLVIFLVILVFGIVGPIVYFYKLNNNEKLTNKLELTIMSIAIITWTGLFINSIINKYMDN